VLSLAVAALRPAVVGARAVVGEEQDESVVEFAGLPEVGHEPAEFGVDPVDQPRVGRHAPGLPRPHLRRQRLPRRDVGRTGARLQVLSKEAEIPLLRGARGADRVPAGVVAAEVVLVVGLQRLQRSVRRVEREVEEPRLLRFARLAEEAKGVVDVRDGRVEVRRRHGPRLAVQTERAVAEVVIACPREMAEGALEPEVGGVLRQVPLAGHRGEVAGGLQNLGQDHGAAEAFVTRLSAPAAGEEAHARRMALGGVVELREPEPVRGEPVQDWCLDLRAVAADVREPEVVREDHQEVRPCRGGPAGMRGVGTGDTGGGENNEGEAKRSAHGALVAPRRRPRKPGCAADRKAVRSAKVFGAPAIHSEAEGRSMGRPHLSYLSIKDLHIMKTSRVYQFAHSAPTAASQARWAHRCNPLSRNRKRPTCFLG
jgi:hypothetical protein